MSMAVDSRPYISPPDSRRSSRRKLLLWSVYLIGFALFVVLLADGYTYYRTPYPDRPHHADYRELRPAGSRGLAYGITGSAMMLLMLVYTLRKRTRLLGRRTPLRPFLDFHIFMGVFGPLFILLHTSFKVQGLVAIAFWSMVAVALSGYLGRYLYQQIPRNAQDRELSLQEIDGMIKDEGDDLALRGRLSPETVVEVNRLIERAFGVEAAAGDSLWGGFVADLKRPLIRSRLLRPLRRLTRLSRRECESLLNLAARRALLRRRLALLGRAQRLFHYWHVIHKPFAIVMYVIMFVHIGVAAWTGYGWFR
ncbi:MAG: hypothetical protein C4532_04100 [Candidatus Abyssobacteria bacterium SURF_17]|uniref:Uncharacterized protein n=1 Tax=Candidatus Abyssobacteria bacterium SURF_17 TaxID=2093361 RepID=A0A419F5E0_9BACT|nr:MAG: hypothetical protein C4532_04100 [Candidatus Abyssubacteria bacterium SURF_17]